MVAAGHGQNYAAKEKPKARKGPGRPPKRLRVLSTPNLKNVKRRKSVSSVQVCFAELSVLKFFVTLSLTTTKV